ncbi:MAG: hypothetical protein Q6361_07125, partial [Candidatus Hermodarchaeota archaeon]|nr:hypothetical protein [Candidatus Hermodarchaeota archaeon]
FVVVPEVDIEVVEIASSSTHDDYACTGHACLTSSIEHGGFYIVKALRFVRLVKNNLSFNRVVVLASSNSGVQR